MTAWADAAQAAALLAVDPVGIAGVVVRSPAGPLRERWLDRLRALLPADAPWRRMPSHIGDERLLGGLDLAATLHRGQPVARRGLLAEAHGGVLLLAMAERLAPAMAARLALVLDTQQVTVQRDGVALQHPARLGVVALDEGMSDAEHLPGALAERLGIHLVLDDHAEGPSFTAGQVLQARLNLPRVDAGDAIVQALCEAAFALGVASARAPLLALRVARAAAALTGRREVAAEDAALAARLVLAPRATLLPPQEVEAEADPPPPPEPPDAAPEVPVDPAPGDIPLEDQVLEAALSALPPGLLAALRAAPGGRLASPSAGRVGAAQRSLWRGRPIGAHRGDLRGGARLDLIETLRAAAPWQPLRRREVERAGIGVQVRREDFHVKRFRQRRETTTIFAVDASGSAALQRLAEAKGAVELLLADCYVRRDRVALLAFRGPSAQLLLPPTRSLVRAKRCLAALPGGGGTPLAAGIDAARVLAEAVARQGGSAVIVVLTDGRANIARDGAPGREHAHQDALAAARALRASRQPALWIDTARASQPPSRELAVQMGAVYVALPHADAKRVSEAVRNAWG